MPTVNKAGVNMTWESILENAIIGATVTALVEDGFRLELSDQDGGGFHIYAAPDGGEKPCNGYKYWVKLVLGNGADVIVDYTTNLEATLAPVNKFAQSFHH
jgi:hypothetical protein